MPIISILTSVYAPSAKYLDETVQSVISQKLPENWNMEWVVQEDGINPKFRKKFESIEKVKYASNNAQLGVSVTRNLALERVNGSIVQLLDHDDILLEGSLNAMIKALSDETIHWVTGQADDLLSSGERVSYSNPFKFGRISAGEAFRNITDESPSWPIHVAAMAVRTHFLRAVGGWPAMPASDDYLMFAAISGLADGYNLPEVTWLYRRSLGQQSETQAWKKYSKNGRNTTFQRVEALRKMELHD